MKIAVPKEIVPHERRVALVPDTVRSLVEKGFEVVVQEGAGVAASFSDEAYREAGASLAADAAGLYGQADVVLKVQRPVAGEDGGHEADLLREGSVLIAFLQPAFDPDLVRRLARRKVTAFSMDLIPRITRAQKMDALSSQATVAGYKAVLIAANSLGRFLPMLMTAAGTIRPARVLVLGAGVAGLQAIATARRLGAEVYAFDVRPAVKEQVQSLGARFIEVELEEETEDTGGYAKALSEESHKRELELIGRHIGEMDVVITTAQIPGREAPLLVTGEMVKGMRPGSVIVDLASETGGNCELTEAGKVVERHGVRIHGPLHLPSAVPTHASQMYSRNVSTLLLHLVKEGSLALNFEDEITAGSCVTHEGRILHGPTKETVES